MQEKKSHFSLGLDLNSPPKTNQKKLLIIIIGLIVLSWITDEWSLRLMDNVETATSAFDGGGVGAVPAILVYGIFHTALPEELLFRGFLLKRIKSKFSFTVGSTVQAVLFGLLHGAEFMGETEIVMVFALIIFTFIFAFQFWIQGSSSIVYIYDLLLKFQNIRFFKIFAFLPL